MIIPFLSFWFNFANAFLNLVAPLLPEDRHQAHQCDLRHGDQPAHLEEPAQRAVDLQENDQATGQDGPDQRPMQISPGHVEDMAANEHRHGEDEFIVRLGAAYDVPLSGWTIAPVVNVDLLEGGGENWIYGLGIGRGF